MSISSIDSRIGKDALRRACRRQLQSLGVGERQAAQMAEDEFADGRPDPVRQVSANDQRVFPHPDGWLVTRNFDASTARVFEGRTAADRYARRKARNGGGRGILFYDQDGCALVYVSYPAWREEKRPRPVVPAPPDR